MSADVKIFLESGQLEEYLLGIADEEQIPVIERYIRQHPEVKAEYESMQAAMEQMALEHGIPAPKGTKEAILVNIDRTTKPSHGNSNLRSKSRWVLAAGLVALISGLSSLYFYTLSADLKKENSRLTIELEQQNLAMQQQAEQCQLLENRFKLLSDPNTATLLLKGNQKAPDLQIVAYWNEAAQASFLHLIALPELPARKCFQIWADVDGEMISLGVLPNQSNRIVSIPFKMKAASLNVTVEPEGGSQHPTVADLVANVSI